MAKQISVIPCLDMFEGRVVKGVKFEKLRDAGDAVELAHRYFDEGADEIAFLDVSASTLGKRTMDDIVSRASSGIGVPLVVGGGIGSVEDAKRLLDLGATRVSVNTSALARPELINELSETVGSDAVVVSLDVATNDDVTDAPRYEITTHGGKQTTGLDALKWAREVQRRGAGTIMLNSIAEDGVQSGYDLGLIRAVRDAVAINLIASGGAGRVEDFVLAAQAGADAVLAASVFHFGTVTVPEVKAALVEAGFDVAGGAR
ncbi:imidazole glycerol phosphate synthase subunit HisF [Actinomyces minihominis]|uniref:imidazole glycerol phosphate synthase subunit HisF n=1 Tax=Actinomyces minihominis TaxID=2002838 RepID=UPI000C07AAAE|nr:imidazole glycerol phosphate synthase subunit HisF [Actinomyces minihominis]